MAEKHQPPQVPKPGGGTKERERREDGGWDRKRSDTGKHHKKPAK